MYNDNKLETNWKKLLTRITEGAANNGWPAGYTSFKRHTFKGHTIETAYNEDSSSALAWDAFVKGFGTYSGASREEALEKAKNKITHTVKESALHVHNHKTMLESLLGKEQGEKYYALMESDQTLHERNISHGELFIDITDEDSRKSAIEFVVMFKEDSDQWIPMTMTIDVDGQFVDNGYGETEYWGIRSVHTDITFEVNNTTVEELGIDAEVWHNDKIDGGRITELLGISRRFKNDLPAIEKALFSKFGGKESMGEAVIREIPDDFWDNVGKHQMDRSYDP